MTKRITMKPRIRSTTKAMAKHVEVLVDDCLHLRAEDRDQEPDQEEAPAASHQRSQHEASEVQPEGPGANGEDLVRNWSEGRDGDRPHVAALVLPLDVEDALLREEAVQQRAAAAHPNPVTQHGAEKRPEGGYGREAQREREVPGGQRDQQSVRRDGEEAGLPERQYEESQRAPGRIAPGQHPVAKLGDQVHRGKVARAWNGVILRAAGTGES